ncbi:helix-turn-helix transcriptional regulator [Curtobacterium sp. ISL-83]|nr:helix-turn-helix transcriptional regulator [Curtobacterium sp. ISL-83]
MTQQELAEKVGSSLRTIGNWERSGVVPRKWWSGIKSALPAAEVELPIPPRQDRGTAHEEDRNDLADAMSDAINRFRQRASEGGAEQAVEQQIEIYEGAVDTLDWAEIAIAAGVDSDLIGQLTAAVVSVFIDAGTLGLMRRVPEPLNPMTTIVYRAAAIAEHARQVNPARPQAPRLSMPANVAPVVEDDEEHIEFTNDVQSAYDRAAHRGRRKADIPYAE